MLTKNIPQMIAAAELHVRHDQLIGGAYWDNDTQKGCFIGCHTHSDEAAAVTELYGIPEPLVLLCETVHERLWEIDRKETQQFHIDMPKAIARDDRDLSKVQWRVLQRILLRLPVQIPEINVVIEGIGRLAEGGEWPAQAARVAAEGARAAGAAAWAAARAARVAAEAARDAARAARSAARVAETAANAVAADAAAWEAERAAAWAAERAAAWAAARAAGYAAWAAEAAARAAAYADAWEAERAAARAAWVAAYAAWSAEAAAETRQQAADIIEELKNAD